MSAENPITILIAEDQEIIRLGIKSALRNFPDILVVAESADGVAAVRDALAVKPQVILMDIRLPQIDGITASAQIKQSLPDVRVIMFTSLDDDKTVYAALAAGADGYCLKDVPPEHLYAAIKAVAVGVAWLDPSVADLVLRSQYIRHNTRTVTGTETNKADIPDLNDCQIKILQLLSQGADLQEVAMQFNLTPESVAKLVNATISKLQASAATHAVTEVNQRTMLTDRYSIESVLGRGGMGVVYKGKHLLMDRLVAIKMLHPQFLENDIVVRRFQSEAKSLSSLSHPNLVAVFDFGITANHEPYMVMDYHDGKSLDFFLGTDFNIDLRMAIDVFSQVCDALTAVHEGNMLHRDIKPSNIVISKDGLVKLVDFGIAKSIDGAAHNLTMAGEVVGTPKYMSPEQCIGRELDARSDIYALGCVMYEVFAGHPPFAADNYYDFASKHVTEIPSRTPFDRPGLNLSPVLEAIIFKTLAKDPSERYQTASQLKSELQAVARGV